MCENVLSVNFSTQSSNTRVNSFLKSLTQVGIKFVWNYKLRMFLKKILKLTSAITDIRKPFPQLFMYSLQGNLFIFRSSTPSYFPDCYLIILVDKIDENIPFWFFKNSNSQLLPKKNTSIKRTVNVKRYLQNRFKKQHFFF